MTPPDPITRLNTALSGRYQIERELGEGGMATVYLADDLKHQRKVAVKVLRPELAAVIGAERFLAEIRTTANLQHPHILPLFDSGEADGFLFYVMPHVEGESLRARLDREHQLPIDDAVGIATNVAEALDYAHRQGVIHRDIKPANILLQDGKPVVSDFGIALALAGGGGSRLTETGLSLGTPHYMSPEQATGDLHVGAATDLYALGCVLYEMLVGQPPFTGSTAQAVLGKIITGDAPSAKAERASVPPNVDAVIAKALTKVPADRFRSGRALAGALADPGFAVAAPHAPAAEKAAAPTSVMAWAGWLVAAVLAAVLVWPSADPEPQGPLALIEDPLPAEYPLVDYHDEYFDLAPDGSQVAYVSRGDPLLRIMVRRLGALGATPVPGTERGTWPAVSPDGRRLAFRQDTLIKVVSIDGASGERTLGTGESQLRWGPEDWIYFTRGDVTFRAPADGGEAEQVTRLSEGEEWVVVTDFLPGGGTALVGANADGERQIRVLDLGSGEWEIIQRGGQQPQYADGYLFYRINEQGDREVGQLLAAPFDPDTRELGDAVVLAGDQPAEVVEGYSVSRSGSLFYPIRPERAVYTPAWVDRDGGWEPVERGWDELHSGSDFTLSLSNQGDRMAVSYGNPFTTIYLKDLPAGRRYPLTAGQPGSEQGVDFDSDGSAILYEVWGRGPEPELHYLDLTGEQPTSLVFTHDRGLSAAKFSSDGRWIVYRVGRDGDGGDSDLYFAPRDEAGAPLMNEATPFLDSDRLEEFADFSPDGRWIAYVEQPPGGQSEIFVRPFPDVNQAPIQISESGGLAPVWSPAADELFYISSDGWMTSVRFDASPESFIVREHTALFEMGPFAGSMTRWPRYQVTPDGQRFLMFARVPAPLGERRDVWVLNFAEHVRRLAGG